MVRPGMSALIQKLRQMCEATNADYTIAGVTYWSDDHLQEMLDEHRTRFTAAPLVAKPTYVGGQHIYTRYEIPWAVGNAVEGVGDNFRVYDSNGLNISPDDYTFNDRDLSIEFDADQLGEARYWDGYGYDVQRAARGIWLAKAAHVHTAINFSADGHRFDREALYTHCIEMAKVFGYKEAGSVMKASRLVRSDLSGGGRDWNG